MRMLFPVAAAPRHINNSNDLITTGLPNQREKERETVFRCILYVYFQLSSYNSRFLFIYLRKVCKIVYYALATLI